MGIGWDKGMTERTYGEKNLKLQPLYLKPKQCIQVKTLPPPGLEKFISKMLKTH